MDWSHFGMDRPAFRPAVDTSAYFGAATHEAALAALVGAFARRDPAVLIDGPSGTGKSLVARKWLDDLLPDVPRVLIPNARAATPGDLLQAILFDVGRPYADLGEQELRLAVTGHLLDAASGGFPTVVVIDEAQHLSQSALEELRLLGNLEARHGAAVFAVLVAHPKLRSALRKPGYEAIGDRVPVRAGLAPLTPDESAAYLRHQVRAAGGEADELLDAGAAQLLAAACGGVPRVLNRAAALAFELAAMGEAEAVDVEAALAALEQLGLTPPDEAEGGGDVILLPHPGRNKADKPEAGRTKGARKRPA